MKLSITWRIRLLSAILTSLVLVVLVGVASYQVRRVLYGTVEEALRAQAAGFTREPRRGPRGRPPEDAEGQRDHRQKQEPPPLNFGTTSLLFPRRLSLETQRTNEGSQPWSQASFERARAFGEDFTDARSTDGERLFVFSQRSGDVVVQTAANLTQTDATIGTIQQALLSTLPPLLLLSAFFGAFLTEVALAPIRQLTRAAAALQPSNLAARLPTPGGGDTFDQLATVLNRMLGRIESAFDRQKRFTSDASHELRTPLAVVRAATSYLLEDTSTFTAGQTRTLRRVDQTVDRATRLVGDLLLLARTENATLPVHRVELAPLALFEEVVEEIETVTAAPHAQILIDTDPSLRVWLDQALVHRLLGNLLSNALRHTPATGRVTLTCSIVPETPLVEFRVVDTGEGIAPEIVTRLGEPFFRPDESRARTQGGAGLGLAICKAIAAAHGGSLQMESSLGVGTTVTVLLAQVLEEPLRQ